VLRTDEGRTVRVPNHVLLESVVTLLGAPGDDAAVGKRV
jgi:hypothetical protein